MKALEVGTSQKTVARLQNRWWASTEILLVVYIIKCVIRMDIGDHCISRVVCGEHSSCIENCCVEKWKCHFLLTTYTVKVLPREDTKFWTTVEWGRRLRYSWMTTACFKEVRKHIDQPPTMTNNWMENSSSLLNTLQTNIKIVQYVVTQKRLERCMKQGTFLVCMTESLPYA